MKFYLKAYVFAFALLFLFSLVVAIVIWDRGRYPSPPATAEVTKKGAMIILSLEDFKSDKGTYPLSLEDLIPKYFISVPRVNFGTRKWEYNSGKDTFSLYVRRRNSGYGGYYYHSKTKNWMYDQ